jgi:HK97 family phage major capsid protein
VAIFNTTNTSVLLPREIADGMVKKSQSLSTVALLSQQKPMRFGKQDIIVFDNLPKAEFVEEGADKASTTGSFSSVSVAPHKAQVTMRFSQEVMWADEDYQLGVLDELAQAGAEALSRALDLGLYHAINPLTGAKVASWTNFAAASTKVVEMKGKTAEADVAFRAAVGQVVNGANPAMVTGAAFDPKFSWALSELRRKDGAGDTSDQRYPQLGFGTNVSEFLGVPVAQGNTVSATPEATDTKVRAIVGDFTNGVRWGIQRQLPVELIQFGDPDGQGDLKRKNQVALRLETVYAWYVFTDRFALVKEAAA